MKNLRIKIFAILFLPIFFNIGCQYPQVFSQQQSEKAIAAYTELYRRPLDTSRQKIMLVGDSMTGVLRWKFRDYCEYNGHELYVVIWDAASTIWYNKHDTLKYYIDKIKPTYIFLVLGANELFVKNVKKNRLKYVKGIIKQIGDIPFVWIGPPNWKKDSGINDLISCVAGIGRYFPSYKVSLNNPNFKRYSDGAHPRPSAAQIWTDSIASWVMKYALKPIVLKKPPHKGSMKFKLYYMAPMIKKDTLAADTSRNQMTDTLQNVVSPLQMP